MNYQTSSKEIYNKYRQADNIVVKNTYKSILERRASYGSTDAQEQLDKIKLMDAE